ncbi:hypothetical protein C9374_012859 [Naegleria lovaniensis]|uniref:Uncharacterized protein n=1 Tax=Naegleria lovaniensis TaxID=51637 RepID=A0AA88G7K1_NAELO|nr:uncharacterized protein C9374_012859 [Naegleria lovaniensis]KAG2373127.1 hypothetical protein C9374_012859 [Naegleria lovaniensis]
MTASPTGNSMVQHQLNVRFTASQALDIYYNTISLGFPMYERQRLEQALEFQLETCFIEDQTFSVTCELEKDVAVLQTLQAVCLQQLGMREISDQLFMVGKQIIGKYYDEVDSIGVVVAMKFIAEYLLGNGEQTKSRAMYSTVRAKLEPLMMECRQHASTWFSSTCVENNATSYNQWHDIKPQFFTAYIIESQIRLDDLYFLEDMCPDTFIFDEFTSLGNGRISLAKIHATSCRDMSFELYHELMMILQTFVSFSDVIMGMRNQKHSLLYVVASMVAKQLHLEILTNCKVKNEKEILRVARETIELTKHQFFSMLPCYATKAVVLACSLRVQYFPQLVRTDNLQDDLNALKLLSTRYRLIHNECSQLIKTIEALIIFQHQQQQHASSSHSELVNFLSFSYHDIGAAFDANLILSSTTIQDDSRSDHPEYDSAISLETSNFSKALATFSRYKDQIKQFAHGLEQLEIVLEGFSEQTRIRNAQSDSTNDQLEDLKQAEINLVNSLIQVAKRNGDVKGLLEVEILKKQDLFMGNVQNHSQL